MRKITILLALLLFAVSQGAFAQKTITGKVISSEDGLGMVGVPVVVKGTTIGTATDIDGAFTLNVPADATTIVVSFIGFKTVELPLGTQTSFEVTMTPDVLTLGDVVVTALGIQRDKKTLTYASQQVSGAEMMKAKDINFMNSLSGKTAGLEIKKAASGAGGSTRTVLRGSKSLSGLSEPLYVIDGVPMVNRKGSQAGMWGGVDEGDGLSQLNPEDIESVSVLKGSNAAVLYGSQGANGVVMITTKKGKEGAVNVNLSSATIFESVLTWPELQYNYGAIGNAKESWSKTPLSSYDDKFVKDFFQTGYNLVNNISISGGNNRTTAYFSYANTSARGVIPTNTYDKNNVTFKQSTKLFNDKVKISSNIMLTSERSFNRPANGYYLNTLTGLYFFPRQKDFNTYKNEYQIFNTGRNLYLQNWFVEDHHQSNPYWILNNEPKEDLGKRAIASANAEWEIAKGFKFQARANYDYADKSYEQKHMAGSNATNVSANGRWAYKKYTDWLAYVDGIFTYNNYFGDFSVNALAGGSFQQTRYGDGVSVDNGTNSLMYPNEFYFQNIPSNVVISSTLASKVIKQGVFANAQLGFKEMIFLDLSGRNDWSSTLAGTGNDSYFYPAIGLSGVLSQMLPLPEFVSFAKVRGSYTTVANEV
ncbi:MAG TPA: SusC/RagA family TonB-linked outer membrane protein, partial [Bacteroidales bacterium]|nr:SusC/RagA family TonB-linked outer membrane protein [Bacteroidales bacterium]